MRILFLDIETSPILAHTWGIWQQNIGVPQIVESSYVLSWAAKWLGDDSTIVCSKRTAPPKKMIKMIHKMLDQADVVVHYNGTKFDIPTLNKEFLLHGLNPPSPYKQIDLLKTVRQQFRFPSNKLEYVVKALKVGEKVKHSGHDLWVRCMAGDNAAWDEMERYNGQDTILLERLYYRLRPWIRNHPNHALYNPEGENHLCPNCGGMHLHRRGTTRTALSEFVRYQCQDCGTWSRSAVAQTTTEQRKTILRPV